MFSTGRSGDGGGEPRRLKKRLLAARYYVYGLVLVALVFYRGVPLVKSYLGHEKAARKAANTLVLSGLDLAPGLIPRVVETYRRLYPSIDCQILGGGTRQALEDLFNRKADVAFTSRPMTGEEEKIVRAIGETAISFPIALGGIAVLASKRIPVDSLRVSELRTIMQGGIPPGLHIEDGPLHLYAPDPNLGLWTALCDQLGLPDSVATGVIWLAGDSEVVQAVAADPHSVGFASTLALPPDLDRMGVQGLRVLRDKDSLAARPDQGAVAVGEYPLYHYLYVSCRPDGGPLASGFVSFLNSGRGQRLVEREGFLPARQVSREIQLSQKPYTKVG
jgi:phosphate transport system substrate-binding protein